MCKLNAWENIYERDVLYQQVWSMPMLQLAKGYGISNSGLKKICLQLDIPVPPAGYWAKMKSGKSVGRIVLPLGEMQRVSGRRTTPRTTEFTEYGVMTRQYRQETISSLEAEITQIELPLLNLVSDLMPSCRRLEFLDVATSAKVMAIAEQLQVSRCATLAQREKNIFNALSNAIIQVSGGVYTLPPVAYMDNYYKIAGKVLHGVLHTYFCYMDSFIQVQFHHNKKEPTHLIIELSCYFDCKMLCKRQENLSPVLDRTIRWSDSTESHLEEQLKEIFLSAITLAGLVFCIRQREDLLDEFEAKAKRLDFLSQQITLYQA